MAQFTLTWDNSAVLPNTNATAQRVSYRRKLTGGAFITTGFTPSNDLLKTATTATSPILLNNFIYEFKVESICTQNGPTINDNGIREGIQFICIVPNLSKTETTATISLDVSGTTVSETLDITKARFTLRRSSDNSIVYGPTTVNKITDTISTTATGLTAATNYYWQVELFSTINAVEVVSSSVDYLGAPCSPYPITTDAPAVCNPISAVTVSSIEIP